ncbi:MAG: Fe-S cluster assembly protein SufD, partial [Acidobacteriota bacterium]|nr:Fe-S cluster assembly protein SufD [Acidobacteriota bacterium]
MKAQAATIFDEAFRESIGDSAQPEWLVTLRREAFANFTQKGFPTTRDEEWKYTDVKAVASKPFAVGGANSEPSAVRSERFAVTGELIVAFVDGVFRRDLSVIDGLPDGVTIASFADSLDKEVLKANLSKIVEYDFNAFTALNTAFTENGVFIHVTKNVRVDKEIHVIFASTEERANFPRVLFVGDEGSEAELVEVFTRTSEARYLTNTVAEIVLEPNARLKHSRVQRESHKAFHIGVSKARLSKDSVYDATNINLGGKIARHDANLEFTGEGAEAWVDGLYLVEDGQHTDTHSRIDHTVKNCVSHQNYKGILDGKSRAVFNGKVFVHKDASGTDANQSNKNLLLSNDARVDTKPQLEIYNDDVKCAHGATVGQLEGEEMFYLLSRGLNEDLA